MNNTPYNPYQTANLSTAPIEVKKDNAGWIAGVVIAVLVVVALLIFLLVWFLAPKNKSSSNSPIINPNTLSATYNNASGEMQLKGLAYPNIVITKINSSALVNGVEFPSGSDFNNTIAYGCFTQQGGMKVVDCTWGYSGLVGQLAPGTPVFFSINATDKQGNSQNLSYDTAVPLLQN